MFNVGTGIETSVNQLAHLTGRAMDRDVEIRHIDRRDIDNIRRRVVNIEKARRMLRWSPQITMENGLRRTAEWFVAAGFAGGLEPDPVVAARGTTVRPGLEARAVMTAAVATASEATTMVRGAAAIMPSVLAGSTFALDLAPCARGRIGSGWVHEPDDIRSHDPDDAHDARAGFRANALTSVLIASGWGDGSLR